MAWKNVQYENGKYRTSEGGGGGGSSTFAGLDDVDFSNLQNGQVPKYNSTTQKWENANESGGGGTVTDVKVDGQSVVDPQTGEANITMPTPPTIPVEDVKVNGESVVNAQKVAEIKSYKEVTQAEYNALPDSKLNDGILYAIKDSAGADGFPPLIYSDEEREIGVWRDGKPLYQKSFKFINSVTFDNGKTFDTNISDMDFGFVVNAVFYDYGQNRYETVPFYQTINTNQDQTSYIQIGVQSNTKKIVLRTNASWSANNNRYLIVTLLYTKTTDTPGSGTWTTQGGYAHHYSTTEHIVGTWIDGKPLYEITIPTGTLPNNTSMDLPTPSNIKEVVNYSGFIKSTTDATTQRPIPFSAGGTNDIRVDLNSSTLRIWTFSDWRTYSGYLVVQYTKTTD